MGAFISKQPNGLYCRFSTIVDCITHYNFTEEDYINNITGTVKDKKEGKEIIDNYTYPFQEVLDRFQEENMSVEEFNNILRQVGYFEKL